MNGNEDILNYIIKYCGHFNITDNMDIKCFLKQYGFDDNLDKLIIDDELINIKNKLKQLHIISFKNTKKYWNLDFSNDFLNNFFKLHDIYNQQFGFITPFELPILYIDAPLYYGGLIHGYHSDNNHPTFYTFLLSEKPSILYPIIYSHEIIHTQLFSTYGSIKNYYNKELLPIFIEYLYLYNYCYKEIFDDLIKLHTYSRFKYLINQIKNIEKKPTSIDCIEDISYLVSTIMAYNLFYIYNNNTNVTQTHIIKRIQQIFDGNYQLEELINEFELNQKIIKKEKF